ncbi:MAG TPA: hypothetical protein GXX36_12350 [Clostridiaceae bacterium]|nr:hypothetical protein [Clostridiaceae bacterium]
MKKADVNKKSKNTKKDKQSGGKYTKYVLIFGALLVVAIVAIVLITAFNQNSKDYVAKVGSEKINLQVFDLYLEEVKSAMLNEAQINPDTPQAENFWKTANFDGLSATEEAKRQALDALRELKIQVMKAKEKNVKLLDEEKKILSDQAESDIQYYGNRIDVSALKQLYMEQYLAYKFYLSETSAINITDDEIKSVYDSDPKSFDMVTARHILISKRNLETGEWYSEEEQQEAENMAKDLLERVNAGEDMEKLAQEYSEDTGVTENGGLYTFTKFDSYVQEFKDWAINANVGDTGIVESTYGYHVMRLENRETIPYEDVEAGIKNSMLQEKFKELLEEWKKDPAYAVKINDKVYNTLQ